MHDRMKQSRFFANKHQTPSILFRKTSGNTLINSSSSSSSSTSNSNVKSNNNSSNDNQIGGLQQIASSHNDSGGDVCPICLGAFVSRAMIFDCRHYYCKDCISTWATKSPCCPLCKVDISRILNAPISPLESSGISGKDSCSNEGEVLMSFARKRKCESDEFASDGDGGGGDGHNENDRVFDYFNDSDNDSNNDDDDEGFVDEGNYPSYYNRFQRHHGPGQVERNESLVPESSFGYEDDGFVVPDELGVEYDTSVCSSVCSDGSEESLVIFDEDNEEEDDNNEEEDDEGSEIPSSIVRRHKGTTTIISSSSSSSSSSNIDLLDKLCELESHRIKKRKRRRILSELDSNQVNSRPVSASESCAIRSIHNDNDNDHKHKQKQKQKDSGESFHVDKTSEALSLEDLLRRFAYQRDK